MDPELARNILCFVGAATLVVVAVKLSLWAKQQFLEGTKALGQGLFGLAKASLYFVLAGGGLLFTLILVYMAFFSR